LGTSKIATAQIAKGYAANVKCQIFDLADNKLDVLRANEDLCDALEAVEIAENYIDRYLVDLVDGIKADIEDGGVTCRTK